MRLYMLSDKGWTQTIPEQHDEHVGEYYIEGDANKAAFLERRYRSLAGRLCCFGDSAKENHGAGKYMAVDQHDQRVG